MRRTVEFREQVVRSNEECVCVSLHTCVCMCMCVCVSVCAHVCVCAFVVPEDVYSEWFINRGG